MRALADDEARRSRLAGAGAAVVAAHRPDSIAQQVQSAYRQALAREEEHAGD
jgi:hypothetical protein